MERLLWLTLYHLTLVSRLSAVYLARFRNALLIEMVTLLGHVDETLNYLVSFPTKQKVSSANSFVLFIL